MADSGAYTIAKIGYEPPELGAFHLGQQTAKYLDDRAAESFIRQLDLEESIWRSAPFIATGLAAHAAMLAWAGQRLPPVSFQGFPFFTSALLLISSVLLFISAFRWLWEMIKPRTSLYPPRDQPIAEYAAHLNAFHAGTGLIGDKLDEQVLLDLREYMTGAFGEAATSTFENNQIRVKARSQCLRTLMLGFVMVFLCISVLLEPTLTTAFDQAPTKVATHAKQPVHPTPSPGKTPLTPSSAAAAHNP